MDTPGYRILIADRNPNIRSFLKRELMAAGHVIQLASTGNHLIQILYGSADPELIIIDPDFSDIELPILISKLQDRVPPLPVIVHSIDSTIVSRLPPKWRDTLVEKNGCSVETLKIMILQTLGPVLLHLNNDTMKTVYSSIVERNEPKPETPAPAPIDNITSWWSGSG